jgi:hypothetical protein
MVFEDRTGMVLPALSEFVGGITVIDGDVVDVTYEPSTRTAQAATGARARQLRPLRALVASAMRTGVFRLEKEDSDVLAARIEVNQSIDPTLAIYAAYAFNDRHRRDLLQATCAKLDRDLKDIPFDVAMLAGRLTDSADTSGTLGFAPLLSQGWAYLSALRIKLPRGCESLPEKLTQSLWTTFTESGVKQVRETIFRGGERWVPEGGTGEKQPPVAFGGVGYQVSVLRADAFRPGGRQTVRTDSANHHSRPESLDRRAGIHA